MTKEILDIQEEMSRRVQNYLHVEIPHRIVYLDQMAKSSKLSYEQIDKHVLPSVKIEDEERAKGELVVNGESSEGARKRTIQKISAVSVHVSENAFIKQLGNEVKTEVRSFIECVITLQNWVHLQVPRIEDGNNFGVSVQEDVITEMTRLIGDMTHYMDQMGRYYAARGKIVSKIVKYPEVVDYRSLLYEIDEKEFLNMRILISEMSVYYHTLLDLLVKNFQKVTCPRNENVRSMF